MGKDRAEHSGKASDSSYFSPIPPSIFPEGKAQPIQNMSLSTFETDFGDSIILPLVAGTPLAEVGGRMRKDFGLQVLLLFIE